MPGKKKRMTDDEKRLREPNSCFHCGAFDTCPFVWNDLAIDGWATKDYIDAYGEERIKIFYCPRYFPMEQ